MLGGLLFALIGLCVILLFVYRFSIARKDKQPEEGEEGTEMTIRKFFGVAGGGKDGQIPRGSNGFSALPSPPPSPAPGLMESGRASSREFTFSSVYDDKDLVGEDMRMTAVIKNCRDRV